MKFVNVIPLWPDFLMQTSKAQFDRILSFIEHGKSSGAALLTGGKPMGNKGYYIEPTIFANVKVYFSSKQSMKPNIFIIIEQLTLIIIILLLFEKYI